MFVFVPVFVSVFAIVVTECLSYSIIQMQRCLEEAEKLIEIFLSPAQSPTVTTPAPSAARTPPKHSLDETKRMC